GPGGGIAERPQLGGVQTAHQQRVPRAGGTHAVGVHDGRGRSQSEMLVDPHRDGGRGGAALRAHRGGAPQGQRAGIALGREQTTGGLGAGDGGDALRGEGCGRRGRGGGGLRRGHRGPSRWCCTSAPSGAHEAPLYGSRGPRTRGTSMIRVGVTRPARLRARRSRPPPRSGPTAVRRGTPVRPRHAVPPARGGAWRGGSRCASRRPPRRTAPATTTTSTGRPRRVAGGVPRRRACVGRAAVPTTPALRA